MIPQLEQARYVREFVIVVKFTDGTEGELDFRDELNGPIFEPLKDPEYFTKFIVHPELHTLVWPNGADFSPEFLHEKVRVTA